MKHAGQVVTRTMRLENVWTIIFDPQTKRHRRAHLRAALEDRQGFRQPLLHTVRGAGYMVRESKWTCGAAPQRVTHDGHP